MISRRVRYVLLGVFSVVVFVLLWSSLEYSQIVSIISTVEPVYVVLALVLSAISILLRAIGWFLVLSVDTQTSTSFRETLTIFTGSLGAKYVIPGGSFTVQPIVSYYLSDTPEPTSETVLARLSVADIFLLSPFFILSVFSAGYLLQSELRIIHYAIGTVILLLLGVGYLYRQQLSKTLSHSLPHSINFAQLNTLPFISIPNINISKIQQYLRYVTQHASVVITENKSLLFVLSILGIGTAISYSLVFWASALALGVTLSIWAGLLLGWGSQIGRIVPLPGGIGGVEVAGTTLILATTTIPFGKAVLIVILYRILTFWGVVGVGWIIVTSKELLSYTETAS